VLFQKFNLVAAVELRSSKSLPKSAIGLSLFLEYNKFAGGKYKGRDPGDRWNISENDLMV
jgi:hypothetical protein